jgi:hypothetical protein
MELTKQCPRCKAENDSIRKYCKACGSPLGPICDRCGMVNSFEDQFCGTCGLPFVKLTKQSIPSTSINGKALLTKTKQYTPEDIEELLELRRLSKKEESGIEIIGQDDIDKIFG